MCIYLFKLWLLLVICQFFSTFLLTFVTFCNKKSSNQKNVWSVIWKDHWVIMGHHWEYTPLYTLLIGCSPIIYHNTGHLLFTSTIHILESIWTLRVQESLSRRLDADLLLILLCWDAHVWKVALCMAVTATILWMCKVASGQADRMHFTTAWEKTEWVFILLQGIHIYPE